MLEAGTSRLVSELRYIEQHAENGLYARQMHPLVCGKAAVTADVIGKILNINTLIKCKPRDYVILHSTSIKIS
jgi:hypothetical protein